MSDIDDEFEPSDIGDESHQDIDNEFEPHDEKEASNYADEKDFEPYDPYGKQDQGEVNQIDRDTQNTQAKETSDLTSNPLGEVPPINPPKGEGKTVINIGQQAEKKNPPKSQPKPTKSDGKFWDKLDKGIKDFIKAVSEFFVKSDEEIFRELKEKEYKRTRFEK